MIWPVLLLLAFAFAVSLPLTAIVRAFSARLNAFDTPPIPGQVKAPPRRIPNTGGVAIYCGIAIPISVGLVCIHAAPGLITSVVPQVTPHLDGIKAQTPLALLLLACLTALHLLGVVDDRKPIGPFVKLFAMAIPAAVIATFGDTRLLTFLDAPGNFPILSVLCTVLWFLIVTNAMNFIDNMDGLCGGVGVVASSFFLIAAILSGQWFVASCLALLIGSLLGFLYFNAPPARIFMGDGGSLVVGFMLAFLTARITYVNVATTPVDQSASLPPLHTLLMPVVVLAIPLYDFTSVTLLRLSKGKSPFVGDLNHLSHRLVRRGLSRRAAVLIICGLTAITGFSGLLLAGASQHAAILIGLQVLALLLVIAMLEYATPQRETALSGAIDGANIPLESEKIGAPKPTISTISKGSP